MRDIRQMLVLQGSELGETSVLPFPAAEYSAMSQAFKRFHGSSMGAKL